MYNSYIIIAWFTQIAVLASTMQAFYGAPIEAATACSALLLAVTTLSIIPIASPSPRSEQVSLKPVPQPETAVIPE